MAETPTVTPSPSPASMGSMATSITPAAALVGLSADILHAAWPKIQITTDDMVYAMVLVTFAAHALKMWWLGRGAKQG